MKCITHEDRNAVASCAKCGVGLCKICEIETIFRINNSAMCRRCNYTTLIENIKISKKYIRNSYIKTFVYSVIFLLGIIAGIISYIKISGTHQGTSLIANNVVTMLMVWGLATFADLFKSSDKSSTSGEVYKALNWWSNPLGSLIGTIIGFIIGYLIAAIALPLLLIATILGIKNEKNIKSHNENILAQMNA